MGQHHVEIIRRKEVLRPLERKMTAKKAQQIVRRALMGELPGGGHLISYLDLAKKSKIQLDFSLMDSYIKVHRKETRIWAAGMEHMTTAQFYIRCLNIVPKTQYDLMEWRKEARQWIQAMFNARALIEYLRGKDPIIDVLEPDLQRLQKL